MDNNYENNLNNKQGSILNNITENNEEDLQHAENVEILNIDDSITEFEQKRKLLDKTKIVKQTWSILEVYQKINDKRLILDPNYQRREIWEIDKKTAFIESLYMGITIPPIYVVEIPSEDILVENRYEVVDGKQRLTAVLDFLSNNLVLKKTDLEYYADIYGAKKFEEIKNIDSSKTTEMLSSVLDIYVITANSPEFTKYDIFARLNKGAEKLKVNEIRRAIYHSKTTDVITKFIDENVNTQRYKELFTKNDIKRFEDYGRFYRSIAFYLRSNLETGIVEKYNSRPREMINTILQILQKTSDELVNEDAIKAKAENLTEEQVKIIIEGTLELKESFNSNNNSEYYIDACIPFILTEYENIFLKIDKIKTDEEILKSFEKSAATTSNVNIRFNRVKNILRED